MLAGRSSLHGWTSFPFTSSVPASSGTTAITRGRASPAGTRFSAWLFQLTYRESLRDIQVCLRAAEQRLSHRGIRGQVSRNTLAHAHQVRDWRIYADFAQVLLPRARELDAHESFGLELDQAVSAWDATVIDLCLSLFPWAKFRRHQGAGKLHTLLDLRGHIPTIVFITHGKVHEVNLLDRVPLHFGWDFARLYRIHPSSAFFVIRAKGNFRFKRLYSQPVDQSEGVPCDPILLLPPFYAKKDYPKKLRRIRFYDREQNRRLVFLIHPFTLPALTIAKIYPCRWQIEWFFLWIKQHLRIKAFYGTSENAVKTQIGIALSV